MRVRELLMQDYTYDLPDERIAKYPLPERDSSKLLVYKNGAISEDIYRNLATYIPDNSLLVFNDTKVIHARLLFKNTRGAEIEIFCLDPAEASTEISTAMLQHDTARWNCMIGKISKWKEKTLYFETTGLKLSAEIIDRNREAFVIEFKWVPEHYSFAEVLDKIGLMPIPPYLHRTSEEIDTARYQTIFARHEGSVAAPTAGLHFTPQIFEALKTKGIQTQRLTLHVGAGTFKPVKSATIGEHDMHAEWIDVNIETIQQLLRHKTLGSSPIIAVGTTSLRALESLYWMGVKTKLNPSIMPQQLNVGQWEPYETQLAPPAQEVLENLLNWMHENKLERLFGKTAILIAPGYTPKLVSAFITNFHQPGSTLLLLVAASVGSNWKAIYDYALNHNFRFLSYGDGSLLWVK